MKFILFQILLIGALVQASDYAQCGGHYRQCAPIGTAAKVSGGSLRQYKRGQNFKWLGVDESVAEFGTGKYPGTYGIDFRFPDESTIGVSGTVSQKLPKLTN